MRIAIGGSSGLIGQAVATALRQHGHDLVRLVRREPAEPDERQWDIERREISGPGLSDCEAVINLAGAGVADRPWTPARKQLLRDSRVQSTETVVAALDDAPDCHTFLSASATGIYGDQGDSVLTEAAVPGHGFMAELVQAWEDAASRAQVGRDVRVVLLRTAPVLSADGGLLAALRTPFRLGLGGRIGDGSQWMPWITLHDTVRAQLHLLQSDLAGPVNLAAPEPVTNAEFTQVLAELLHRPAVVPMPLPAVRAVMGADLVEEFLLASQRVRPSRLLDDGFRFGHDQLASALAGEIER